MWLAKVREITGQDIEVDWQPFSLAQVNNKEEGTFVWESPDIIDGTDPILLAHKAGLAAKRQGKEAFESFFMALLKARHEDKADLNDREVMEAAAVVGGLDVGRFWEDAADPDLMRELSESHTKAVEEYGAFGVPTFVFDGGNPAFLKMFIPPDEQAVEIYDSLLKTMSQFAHVGELKRPQPPWPHGVI
jgi:protein-disulfide isomerase-like protein with CxxC motif